MLRDLAHGFARDGWEVTVVTVGPQRRKERDGGVRVIRLGGGGGRKNLLFYILVWIRMLLVGLSLPRHDLVVTMSDPPLFVMAGRLIARMKKTRHMNWCQDLYPDLLPSLGIRLPQRVMQWLKVASRRAMKSCDKVVVIGRCMAKHLTHGGLDPRRIAVIPNWPDAELVTPPAAPQTSKILNVENARPYSELFKDTDPKFRILYAGNMGRAHPVQTILDAAGLLALQYPDIEFVFVGEGPAFDRLSQERAKRGLENIRFLPWQPASRLRELMESGDVHLITVNQDAAGLLVPCKLYAALAVGRPVIMVGPQESEAARVIGDFHAGKVVAQGEAAELAGVIASYRMDGERWFKAHEGAQSAGGVFVPEESIKAWIERARDIAGVKNMMRLRKKAA
jgi:glycosyltransferase involved in cell wall biosynthesis